MNTIKETLKCALLVLLVAPASHAAVTIPTIAGIASIAASSGTIIREGHDLFKHPWKTLRKHGSQIKAAAKGKPEPPPNPVAVPVQEKK